MDKPKPKPRSPKNMRLVMNSIKRLKSVRGAKPTEIAAYLVDVYHMSPSEAKRTTMVALKRGVQDGHLMRSRNLYKIRSGIRTHRRHGRRRRRSRRGGSKRRGRRHSRRRGSKRRGRKHSRRRGSKRRGRKRSRRGRRSHSRRRRRRGSRRGSKHRRRRSRSRSRSRSRRRHGGRRRRSRRGGKRRPIEIPE